MPVVLAKKYPKRIENIGSEVADRLAGNEGKTFIYIAPTKRKIRELQREFLKLTPHQTAPAFNLFTLETLAARLHAILCPPRKLISATEQVLIVDAAIISAAADLRYFHLRGSPGRLTKGTLLRIINVVNALKEKGAYLTALKAETESVEKYERHKLNDIIRICEKYEQLLGDRFTDAAGLFRHVNEQWDPYLSPEVFRRHFGSVDSVFVSGFDEFADPELTLLNNLSEISGMGMVISFDYFPDNDQVFGHLRENYGKFLEMGFRRTAAKKSPGRKYNQKITESLFRQADTENRLPAQSHITLIAAEDRRDESEIVAKIIRGLIAKQPRRSLDKICVATFRPDLYTEHFREVFEQYGIPVNITDRYYLDQSPVVVAVLSLLTIHQRGYMAVDIMRALSSVYLSLSYDGKPVSAGVVNESASILKISGGFSAWIMRIKERLKIDDEKLRDNGSDQDKKGLLREKEILKEAENGLNLIRNLLRGFDEAMTPRQFRTKLIELIDNVDLVPNILRGRKDFGEDEKLERDTRALEKFLEFLDEFMDILAFEGKGTAEERLPFYLNRLKESMTQVRYNIRQKYGYGVAVTSMDETRGLDFDVMILAGMVDGEFPPVYKPEIFFSSAQRLRREKYHLHEHRYLFYQMLCNFTEHLYITYPRTDGENELIQSSFIDALTEIVDAEDYRLEYPSFLSGTIFTKSDAIHRIGMVAGRGGSAENELQKIDTNKEISRHIFNLRTRMEVERARTGSRGYPEFCGMIGGNPESVTGKFLAEMRDRIYSVTQLEIYGKCPFLYFAEQLLRLNVTKEIDEELTSSETGALLHAVLYDFFMDRRKRDLKPLAAADDSELNEAYEEICEITRKKLSLYSISSPFREFEEEQIFGSGRRKGILREFLENEGSRTYTVSPAYFEAGFGSVVLRGKEKDPLLSCEDPVVAGRVRLRGKIDRIDTGGKIFRIVDYKTGNTVPNRKSIDNGVSLQLPVYLFAADDMLRKVTGGEWTGVAGVYYMLRNGVRESLGIGDRTHIRKAFEAGANSAQLCGDEAELRQVIQNTIRFVNDYVEGIAAGRFPVDPKDPKNTCNYCKHNTICRIRLRSLDSSEEKETQGDKEE